MATNRMIDFETYDTKSAARTIYDARQRGEQKHRRVRKSANRSTNRAVSLDNRSSANGVNGGRAQRRVETTGNLALDWTVDDYSFTVSEEMYGLFVSEARNWWDYARDAQNAPVLTAGAYRIRLGGDIHLISISAPFQMDSRWRAVMTFEDMPGNIKFSVSLAQLAAVLDFAPELRIVEKPAPATWEPSASALRWTACMIGAARHGNEEAYDLSRCPATVDTSGLFRIVAGYVIEI